MAKIFSSYCCTKCDKCFRKEELKTKSFTENGSHIIEFYCPLCSSLVIREIVEWD